MTQARPVQQGSTTGTTGYRPATPYYPRTDVEFGIKWNDDSVTPILGSNPKEVIRIFMNSIKLKRLGIFTKDHFAVGIVSHTVEKKSAVKDEWLETAWESYSLTQADMLDLYRAG